MADPIVLPPLIVKPRKFEHVFEFPKYRITDPCKNVLLAANLWDFGIDHDTPLDEHDAYVITVVAPLMKSHPAAVTVLTGLASRTGPSALNLGLSKRRANQVKQTFDFFLGVPFGIPSRVEAGGQGDHFAEALHMPKKEDDRFRSVPLTVLADPTKPRNIRLLPP
jgi:hypothetical protein